MREYKPPIQEDDEDDMGLPSRVSDDLKEQFAVYKLILRTVNDYRRLFVRGIVKDCKPVMSKFWSGKIKCRSYDAVGYKSLQEVQELCDQFDKRTVNGVWEWLVLLGLTGWWDRLIRELDKPPLKSSTQKSTLKTMVIDAVRMRAAAQDKIDDGYL